MYLVPREDPCFDSCALTLLCKAKYLSEMLGAHWVDKINLYPSVTFLRSLFIVHRSSFNDPVNTRCYDTE